MKAIDPREIWHSLMAAGISSIGLGILGTAMPGEEDLKYSPLLHFSIIALVIFLMCAWYLFGILVDCVLRNGAIHKRLIWFCPISIIGISLVFLSKALEANLAILSEISPILCTMIFAFALLAVGFLAREVACIRTNN